MGLLVDSSVLINLERRGISPEMLRQDSTEDWAVSAVTMSEVYFGLHEARTTEQRSNRQEFIDKVLAIYPVFPFDLDASRIYASLWAQLIRSGQRIGTHDFMIAATALAHEYALLTDNVREFSRIPGLTVRHPNW